LKRIDHIGVVVDDLSGAGSLLEQDLGLAVVREIDKPDLRAVLL
jgi:hypothetical protein